ncbi:DUF3016 domain-containing protein [Ferrimonas balearica]|uniref:DUF3016 domain-containing protein n=1 Tax=Ferrimonas balearica TaxID=44012 RepID=UPI001C99B6EE|nr:DUF3016 domain-containing protein [Ferrimonas balearica]MBY5922065.1 DUF3016 domain-containing protein [Ferrimonas balearica]MBY5994595.1 DUF3016 domain-containing protein [Ferrimonas balearica]
MSIKPLLCGIALASVLIGCSSKPEPEGPVQNFLTKDGQVTILWKDPAKYADIESTSMLQSTFEKYLFSELTEELGKVANPKLGDAYQLELEVTNVDLPGDVKPSFDTGADDIRVVSDLYPPKMAFTYELKRDGQVVKQGTEKLSDMSFLFGIEPIGNDPFPYMGRMMEEWFRKAIEPELN